MNQPNNFTPNQVEQGQGQQRAQEQQQLVARLQTGRTGRTGQTQQGSSKRPRPSTSSSRSPKQAAEKKSMSLGGNAKASEQQDQPLQRRQHQKPKKQKNPKQSTRQGKQQPRPSMPSSSPQSNPAVGLIDHRKKGAAGSQGYKQQTSHSNETSHEVEFEDMCAALFSDDELGDSGAQTMSETQVPQGQGQAGQQPSQRQIRETIEWLSKLSEPMLTQPHPQNPQTNRHFSHGKEMHQQDGLPPSSSSLLAADKTQTKRRPEPHHEQGRQPLHSQASKGGLPRSISQEIKLNHESISNTITYLSVIQAAKMVLSLAKRGPSCGCGWYDFMGRCGHTALHRFHICGRRTSPDGKRLYCASALTDHDLPRSMSIDHSKWRLRKSCRKCLELVTTTTAKPMTLQTTFTMPLVARDFFDLLRGNFSSMEVLVDELEMRASQRMRTSIMVALLTFQHDPAGDPRVLMNKAGFNCQEMLLSCYLKVRDGGLKALLTLQKVFEEQCVGVMAEFQKVLFQALKTPSSAS